MSEDRRSRSGVIAVIVSIAALGVSVLTFLAGFIWTALTDEGQSLFWTMSICTEYRTEVLDMADRGLAERQIVRLLALEDYSDQGSLFGGSGYNAVPMKAELCGSVAQILRVTGPT